MRAVEPAGAAPAIVSTSRPAPLRKIPFAQESVFAPQFAEPAGTCTVSPLAAAATAAFTSEKLGLAAIIVAALAGHTPKQKTAKSAPKPVIELVDFIINLV